jgi:sec-independent protein translocase protein TatB
VFNLQGGELIIIALLALVVLGPEKLPEAMRHVGRLYRQLRSVRDTFQREFKQALDEPMRDLRKATSGSANTLRDAARSMVDAPDEKAESGNTTPSPALSEQTENLEGESEMPSDDAERP